MKHECEELKKILDNYQDTDITIFGHEDGTWSIHLYDGDGVSSPIKYCPFCGVKL